MQARAVETRRRILDAAARVFSRHGYAAGTTNRIAAEAGLSIGSLYQYFPNKDAILVALVRAHMDDGAAAVAAAADEALHLPLDDVASRVGLVVDAFVDVHAGDPALHQVLFEQAPRPPELLAELRALEDAAIAVAVELLPVAGLGPHARVTTARVVVTTIESLVHRLIATTERAMPVDVVRREVTAVVVRYLSTDPDALDPSSRRSSKRSVEK